MIRDAGLQDRGGYAFPKTLGRDQALRRRATMHSNPSTRAVFFNDPMNQGQPTRRFTDSRPPVGPASTDAVGDDWGENLENPDGYAQPVELPGVHDGMATVAIDASGLQGAFREDARQLSTADSSQLSDAQIMLQVREGDDASFSFLVEKYRRQIVHFMFRMVRNQAIAEELAQEVFLRVYRSRQTYRAEARFSTWLYRIATNLGVNYARDTKYERMAQNVYLDQPDAESGLTPDVADSSLSVEQNLVRGERMKAIREQVMALPERQRTAVLMHKYQGMDYKQIGEVLRLSESATKSLLFRAYQELRQTLKEFA